MRNDGLHIILEDRKAAISVGRVTYECRPESHVPVIDVTCEIGHKRSQKAVEELLKVESAGGDSMQDAELEVLPLALGPNALPTSKPISSLTFQQIAIVMFAK